MHKDKYFFCYSQPLYNFLKEKGYISICAGKSLSSNKIFYLFERDNNLQLIIDEYKQQNI